MLETGTTARPVGYKACKINFCLLFSIFIFGLLFSVLLHLFSPPAALGTCTFFDVNPFELYSLSARVTKAAA